MQPVFVLLTAKGCVHCKHFRTEIWPSLRPEMEKLATIVDVELNSMSDLPGPPKYPADLARYAGNYPTFVLISGSAWKNAYIDPTKGHVPGVVFGEEWQGDKMVRVKRAYTKEALLRWVHELRDLPASDLPRPMLSIPTNAPSDICRAVRYRSKYP